MPVRVRCFVTDTPARAFVVSSRYHGHRKCCHKCDQTTVGRNIAPTPGEPRTDDTFRARKHLDNHSDRHKNSLSVLERYGFGMVSMFPLDVMHLVDLGVGKLIVSSLMKGECIGALRRRASVPERVPYHGKLSEFTPSEFSRRPGTCRCSTFSKR